jgi:hypothetical protein
MKTVSFSIFLFRFFFFAFSFSLFLFRFFFFAFSFSLFLFRFFFFAFSFSLFLFRFYFFRFFFFGVSFRWFIFAVHFIDDARTLRHPQNNERDRKNNKKCTETKKGICSTILPKRTSTPACKLYRYLFTPIPFMVRYIFFVSQTNGVLLLATKCGEGLQGLQY